MKMSEEYYIDVVTHLDGGEFKMFEKLLLAITLTFSLKLFLGLNEPTTITIPLGTQLQQTATQPLSQLPL